MSETMRDACYRCVYRREVPGSAHSSCAHPETSPLHQVTAIKFAGLMGKRVGAEAIAVVGMVSANIASRLNIIGHDRGIEGGWFIWPVNFDPVWLESCDGFQARETQIAENLASYGGGSD